MGSGSHEPEFSTIVDPIFDNVERAQIWPDSPFFATFIDDIQVLRYDRSAGWSSLVARWAHNPKVKGSNPFPATNLTPSLSVTPNAW